MKHQKGGKGGSSQVTGRASYELVQTLFIRRAHERASNPTQGQETLSTRPSAFLRILAQLRHCASSFQKDADRLFFPLRQEPSPPNEKHSVFYGHVIRHSGYISKHIHISSIRKTSKSSPKQREKQNTGVSLHVS